MLRFVIFNISHSSVDNIKFNVPGWNDIVKDVHNEARLAFKLWANLVKVQFLEICNFLDQILNTHFDVVATMNVRLKLMHELQIY